MTATPGAVAELRELDERGEHLGLIAGLRELVRTNRRTLADPWVKQWCGRRWKNLFVTAAAADPDAVKAASQRIGLPGTDVSIRTRLDSRPERERVAARFLKDLPDAAWAEELPEAQIPESLDATLIVCPGLIGSMLPLRAFQKAMPALAELHGWRFLCADAHPMRSSEANVADLAAAIEQGAGLDSACRPITREDASPPRDLFLIGYSKGTADALTLLALRPDLAQRVKALYCWAGAVGGSYLADSIYDAIKDLDVPLGGLADPLSGFLKTVFPLISLDGVVERLDEYDVKGALRDLTTVERARFLDEHAEAIDALDVPIFNITGATSALEVPYFQVQGYLDIRRAGGDPDNDMQVTQAQARMATPMATDLAVLHAHHWDMSYDAFPIHTRLGSANLDHPFPREAALIAIFQLTTELGLVE